MIRIDPAAMVYLSAAIQALGLAATVLAKLYEGLPSRAAQLSQAGFYLLLAAVAGIVTVGVMMSHNSWLAGAATLALMTLGATASRSPALAEAA